jgi:hypothetical protein
MLLHVLAVMFFIAVKNSWCFTSQLPKINIGEKNYLIAAPLAKNYNTAFKQSNKFFCKPMPQLKDFDLKRCL